MLICWTLFLTLLMDIILYFKTDAGFCSTNIILKIFMSLRQTARMWTKDVCTSSRNGRPAVSDNDPLDWLWGMSQEWCFMIFFYCCFIRALHQPSFNLNHVEELDVFQILRLPAHWNHDVRWPSCQTGNLHGEFCIGVSQVGWFTNQTSNPRTVQCLRSVNSVFTRWKGAAPCCLEWSWK